MEMKKRILLIDESLTVQKVVALTLDRSRYAVSYARSRAEAMKLVMDSPPDLVLVSDQVTDITIASFPKEVEAWMGRGMAIPPIVLISGQDIREARHYVAVLKKPFSPQVLQALINRYTTQEQHVAPASEKETGRATPDDFEDQRLQKIFNDTFADESKLVNETFMAERHEEGDEAERTLMDVRVPMHSSAYPDSRSEAHGGRELKESWEVEPAARVPPPPPPPRPAQRMATPADLWAAAAHAPKPKASSDVLGAEDSMVYKAAIESHVENKLESQDLEQVVDKVLSKIIPPIVERLVQERLDRLLKEQEQFVELKP